MPGGVYDSSKTRVAPVFDQLRLRTDDWVRTLLNLAQHGAGTPVGDDIDLAFVQGSWGATERGIHPPVALLSWLIRNLMPPMKPTEINDDRQKLLARDPATIERALQLLRSGGAGRAWHVFEGPTYPDAIIETPGARIVIEGKRTEAGPTTSTTWMAGRHQIWRHMDAAWELRGGLAVFGLFLVEGAPERPRDVPPIWENAARDTLTELAIDASFPHRSTVERDAIARGFLGVATWQRVCSCFGVDFDVLPQTTADLRSA
jgi:hypothetical protein